MLDLLPTAPHLPFVQTDQKPVPLRKRLRERLEHLEQTPAWLADRAGVERSTVTRALSGKRQPSAETLALLAPALGLTVEELVAGTDANERASRPARHIAREHYDEAVRQVLEYEAEASDLRARLRSADEQLEQESERRKQADARATSAETLVQRERRRAVQLEAEVVKYRSALEKAVQDVAALQTALQEVRDHSSESRESAKVAAILAGVAAVASVATYLSSDGAGSAKPKPTKGAANSRRGRRTGESTKG